MIDSHCHLDHEPLLGDLDNVLLRSKNIGITKLLTISTSLESFSRVKEIVNKDNMIYGTIGIHPHEADKNKISSKFIVDNLKENRKIIGIGETGLDFFYDNCDRKKQLDSFRIHIEASLETKVPLIIHSRDAEDETFKNCKVLHYHNSMWNPHYPLLVEVLQVFGAHLKHVNAILTQK